MAILCFVTDRRRFDGAGGARARQLIVERVCEAAAAGVDLVQIREPDLSGRALFDLTRECVRLVRETPTRILVNDRLDVALAAGAGGVHLRETSCDAARIRRITPHGFLIGRSVHGVAGALAAEAGGGLDYLIVGTVFPSRSKPSVETLIGVALLRDTVQAVRLPVLAIGGITISTLPMVVEAGAGGIAAIGLFAPGQAETGNQNLGEVVQAARRVFDTPRPIP